MAEKKFDVTATVVAYDEDCDSTDVRLAVERGLEEAGALRAESVEAWERGFSELRSTHKALARQVLAVAVADTEYQLWAAYIDAVPGKNHEREVPEVQKHGCKLSKELACFMFPQFDPDKYRR